MVLRSEQNTSLHKSKGLQDLYSDFQSDNWCGQTLCDKMDGTLFLGRRKYLLPMMTTLVTDVIVNSEIENRAVQ